MCGSDIFLGFIAILFPPVAGKSLHHKTLSPHAAQLWPFWVKRGLCSVDSLVNIALCCLGFLPGLLHAWYIISAYPDPTYEQVEQDPEGNRVTYYYVQQGAPAPGGSQRQSRSYGTAGASAPAKQFPGQQQGTVPPQQYQQQQGQIGGSSTAPEEVPPSYDQAIKGDHKVQTRG